MQVQLGILNLNAVSNEARTNHGTDENCRSVINLGNESVLSQYMSRLNIASYKD